MEWDTTVSVLQMRALKRYQASRKVYQADTSVAEWEKRQYFFIPCQNLFGLTNWHAVGD